MTRLTKAAVVLASMALAAAVGGLGAYAWSAGDAAAPQSEGSAASIDPSMVVDTSFPDLAAPTGEPDLDGIDTADPAPGSVVSVAGPFDDRFVLSGLHIKDGTVSGRLHITSDVSEVLELQVLAGFYDARGDFLGSGRAVYHLDEHSHHDEHAGPPSELKLFEIAAPAAYAGKVAAASVGVPVLVNE